MPGGLDANQVQREAERLVGKGLPAAGYFLAARVKEGLSIPAPRKRVTSRPRSKVPGTIYYRATSPATPGAMPRKLSGRGRASIAVDFNASENVVRVGTNVRYMGRHERQNHKYLRPTLTKYSAQIAAIIGSKAK